MKALGLASAIVAAVGVGWLLFWPVPIAPDGWTPEPDTVGSPPWLESDSLAPVCFVAAGPGPESLSVDRNDGIHTGLADGRIMRYGADGSAVEVARTGGRPLGLGFDRNGSLIVADARKGLLKINPGGDQSVLVDRIDGKPMLLTDDLAIASNGTIWFTDGSQRFGMQDRVVDWWESQSTGRLAAFDPAAGKAMLVLDDLAFANGVALAPDETFVLVTESNRYRIRRYWLKGPRAGTSDTFLDNLPGFPDGITAADGGFWLAIAAPRFRMFDWLAPYPFLRKMIYRVAALVDTPDVALHDDAGIGDSIFYRVFVEWLELGSIFRSWVVRLDLAGNVLRSLEDPTRRIQRISSVVEHRGKLYIGSIAMTEIGVFSLSDGPGATDCPGSAPAAKPKP